MRQGVSRHAQHNASNPEGVAFGWQGGGLKAAYHCLLSMIYRYYSVAILTLHIATGTKHGTIEDQGFLLRGNLTETLDALNVKDVSVTLPGSGLKWHWVRFRQEF